MGYPIDDIQGIGPAYKEKLTGAGIKGTDDLLKLCCHAKGRKEMAEKTGLGESLLLRWSNMADMMRISGVGPQFAELLEAAGVDTVKELRTRNAENLTAKMAEVNEEKKLSKSAPSQSHVEGWIAQAKSMEPTITH